MKSIKNIISIITASVVMCITASSYSVNTNAVNTSQTYYVYDAQTAAYESRYTLNSLSSSNNTRSIVDTDDRVVDWSKGGVVKLLCSSGMYTGFVIDTHTIATVAHSVYNQTIEDIYLFKTNDTSGEPSLTITNAIEYHVPYGYINAGGIGSNEYDYALIKVEQDLSDYISFNLGVPLDSAVENELAVTVTGFPGVVNSEQVNNDKTHIKYSDSGNMVNTDDFKPDMQLYYDACVSGGNSGGPVYITETRNGKTYNTVVAIHSASAADYAIGTRITTDLIHFYYGNPNI